MSSKKQPNTRQAAAAAAAGEKSADVDKQQSPISTRRHLYTGGHCSCIIYPYGQW